jgi:hypothetical protein
MARHRDDRDLHRINLMIPRADHDWLRAIYGDQYISEAIRNLIAEHRKRTELQAQAKTQLEKFNGR